MASKEEINAVVERCQKCRPKHFFTEMDHINAGISQVLRYLSEASRPVSAGEISHYMNVSTARVAALLRCMEEKGFIQKEKDPADARKTLVLLSESGTQEAEAIKRNFLETVSSAIDRVGLERLNTFIDMIDEINVIVSENFKACKNQP